MSAVLLEIQDVAWFRDDLTGVRAAAGRLAHRIGLGEHRTGEVMIAAAEATSNLVKHAVAGAIVLRVVRTAQHAGVEFLALDEGPGIPDVTVAMRDGRSTTGTLGIGLGTIARLADTFDLHSIAGQGTVMLARFWPRKARSVHPGGDRDPANAVVEGVTRPISGLRECGDSWAVRFDAAAEADTTAADADASSDDAADDRPPALGGRPVALVMLCDGLGHGPLAQMASRAAIRAFLAGQGRSPGEVMREIHQGLAGTRGAAVAVARIEPDQARVLFCAVGDIAGAIVTSTSKAGLPTLPGIAGQQMPTPRTSTHQLPAGSAVILHSDGLTGRWSPGALPGVLRHTPAVIAGHLLRTAGKYHDDASVVVAKGPW